MPARVPNRIVVERILPEVDSGRFPIKRTVGESVRILAWIHADGPGELAAVVRYRPVRNRGRRGRWLEQPLRPLGNDEWTATFVVGPALQLPVHLAKLGFNQSYTSFRWRNMNEELTDYLTELTQTDAAGVRGDTARARTASGFGAAASSEGARVGSRGCGDFPLAISPESGWSGPCVDRRTCIPAAAGRLHPRQGALRSGI